MLFFACETIARTLEDIQLELYLGVLLLCILDFVTEQIELVLNLLCPNIIFLKLAPFNCQLAFRRFNLFPFLRDLGFILSLGCFERRDFFSPQLHPLVQHLDVLLSIVKVLEYTLVTSLEVAMSRVHVIKFTFKFESELDFLLVILGVLRVVFFKLETHLLLVHHFSLEFLTHFLLSVEVLFEYLLVVGLILRFLLVLAVQLLKLSLMLL